MTNGSDAVSFSMQVPRVRDQSYREIYCNMHLTQMGPFDITVIFQKTAEAAPGHFANLDQVAITFSPQNFKALVRSLGTTLEAYETGFGKLTIPEEDITPFRSAEQLTESIKKAREQVEKAKASFSTSPPQPSEQSPDVPQETKLQP
jgi:hypothetical protein